MLVNENSVRKVIPVASGKGGVGKSLVTANLGILLASYGKRTIVVDLDLGGSNLHTYLGLKNRNPGISNFLSSKKQKFEQYLVDTSYDYLQFIPGDALAPNAASITHSQRRSLIRHIEKLDADYVLLDLGSGTSANVIDFFLISNSGLVVVTPQTPAVLNAYNFLKNVVFRHVQHILTQPKKVADYLKDIVKEQQPRSTPTISQIISEIQSRDADAGRQAKDEVSRLRPHLVANMAEAPEDMDVVTNLRDLIVRNLGIQPGCLGLMYEDYAIRRAIKNLEPLASHSTDSVVTRELDRMAQKIIQSPRFPTMPLDLNEYEDSFELARIEAQNDQGDVTGAGPSEEVGVSQEEFMSIIAAQKKQIEELKSHVRMLTLNQR